MLKFAIAFAIVSLSVVAGAAHAAGDDDPGRALFATCSACHAVKAATPETPEPTVGPSLVGVFGRTAGTVRGFRYSRAMKGTKVVWDEKTLDAFLAEPQKAVPGNTMPFAGMPDAAQRAQLIGFLKKASAPPKP